MKIYYKKILINQLYFLFKTNGWLIFLFYCLCIFLNSYVSNNFILTDNLLYNFYTEQFSIEKITEIINIKNKWLFLNYLISPLFYLFKFFSISICILIGLTLSDIKISFNKVFKITLISEFVFIIAVTVRAIYFLFFNIDFTYDEFQSYYPLSLINFFNLSELEIWMKYPLQLANLFELSYILTIAAGLSIELKFKYMKSFQIVFASYISGLILWVVFITFLTVNFGI